MCHTAVTQTCLRKRERSRNTDAPCSTAGQKLAKRWGPQKEDQFLLPSLLFSLFRPCWPPWWICFWTAWLSASFPFHFYRLSPCELAAGAPTAMNFLLGTRKNGGLWLQLPGAGLARPSAWRTLFSQFSYIDEGMWLALCESHTSPLGVSLSLWPERERERDWPLVCLMPSYPDLEEWGIMIDSPTGNTWSVCVCLCVLGWGQTFQKEWRTVPRRQQGETQWTDQNGSHCGGKRLSSLSEKVKNQRGDWGRQLHCLSWDRICFSTKLLNHIK